MFAAYRRIQQKRAIEGSDSGFTLIELLIVIVVLGILAAIVVFSLGTITGKSAVAACQADAQQLNTGLAAYYAANQAYPDMTGPATTGITANNGGGFTTDYPVGLAPAFLQTLPNNPSHYTFTYTAIPATATATTGTGTATGFILTVTGTATTHATVNVSTAGTTAVGDGAQAACAAAGVQ